MADDLDIRRQGDLLLLRLRVSPGARNPGMAGLHGGALKLRVTEPPERGKANDGVIRLLSRALRIPAGQLSIVSGASSRDKRLAVAGFDGDKTLLKEAVLKALAAAR